MSDVGKKRGRAPLKNRSSIGYYKTRNGGMRVQCVVDPTTVTMLEALHAKYGLLVPQAIRIGVSLVHAQLGAQVDEAMVKEIVGIAKEQNAE